MRDMILKAIKQHVEGRIAKHRANVEVFLNKTVGVAEHIDFTESVEAELKKMAEYDDILEILYKYFE
tara:strand:+ start:122 stop:322 length:201 start_codon:yes stop_codon:yes gene_type:complete